MQNITLPPGSRPFDVVAESTGRYLYVSDEGVGAVYVVDIDPFSKTFNHHIATIAVGPAPLGLRGIALNSDDSLLFVTAPGQTLFGAYGAPTGSLLVIQTNAATRQAPVFYPQSSLPTLSPTPIRASSRWGPSPTTSRPPMTRT